MGEIKNTHGASAEADRALASGEAPVGSSSFQDGDPSRNRGKVGVLIFSKKLQEFWLAPGHGTTPLSREAFVYDLEYAKSRLSSLWDRYELRSVDGAQAIEARQGGDAEGGSVEDKSAVAAGDVPASRSQVHPPSSTPGEVERLVDHLIEIAQDVVRHQAAGSRSVFAVHDDLRSARTALLSHISTAGRGEGSAPDWIVEFVRSAANTVAQTTLPGSAFREVAERAFAWAVIEGQALSAADATNPQDQE